MMRKKSELACTERSTTDLCGISRSMLGAGSAAALALVTSFGAAAPAVAADITFAVIGPHEYELPVNFKPFNVFVQYGQWNNQSKAYDASGKRVDGSGGDLFVGLSKYVYFWTFDAIPDVGFAYEIIVPEVRIDVPGFHEGGVGDPLTGPAVWFKPNANSTIGFQSFLQIPIGGDKVTNDYWANYSSLFYDYQWEHFSFTGNTGFVFRTDRKASGLPDIDQATTFHTNVRFGWKASTMFEPFVGVDYQRTGTSRFTTSNAVAIPSSNETALGVGLMVNFSPKTSLTVRYSHAVDGKNTTKTNGVYGKYVLVW
jgi:hypothetical protein